MSAQQAMLFAFIYQVPSWARPVVVDGKTFYAISKAKIIEELPLLTDKADTAYRILKAIEVIEVIEVSSTSKITLIRITDKGREWNRSENNPTYLGRISDLTSEESPTNQITSNQITRIKNKTSVFDPAQGRPQNVSPDVWEGFCKMRKQKRALLTERACELIARKLLGLSKEAADGVVDQSTASSWSDVYPEKAVKQAAPAGNGKRPRPTNLPEHKFPHPEWDNGVYEICTVGRHNPETGYLLPGQY